MKDLCRLCIVLTISLFLSSCSNTPVIGKKYHKIFTENGSKVFRNVTLYSIETYNEHGNMVEEKYEDHEISYEYNDKELLIYKKKIGQDAHDRLMSSINLDDFEDEDFINYYQLSEIETWYDYDNNGNKILETFSYGHRYSYEYDSNGNMIHIVGPNNYEVISKYDEENNLIYEKILPYETETWYEYENNRLIYKKVEPDKIETWYLYDKNNNLIEQNDSIGNKLFFEYDYKNQLIHEKNTYGDNSEIWYEYDYNGNKTYQETSFGIKDYYEYDKNNNLLYCMSYNEYVGLVEYYYEYTYHNNGKLKCKKCYIKKNT